MKRSFITALSFCALYFASWWLFGEQKLWDQALTRFIQEIDRGPIGWHSQEEFFVIAKKDGAIAPVKFDVSIPGKKLVVAQNENDQARIYANFPEDFSWEIFRVFGTSMTIRSYTFPFAEVDYWVLGNDINSRDSPYVWGFFCWVQIPI